MTELPRVFAVYKPKGPTSAHFLNELKRKFHITKMGHAGTLDPLASGVLVVGVNEGTKELHAIVQGEKEYEAVIRLGVTSTTDDEEGEKKEIKVKQIPGEEKIRNVLQEFVGIIEQIPPAFSAIKIKGQEAYKLIRKGIVPEMKPREVKIFKIDLVEYSWPILKIRVTTGPGVYIRALARDIGAKLGAGAYLADLERTRVGEFTIRTALLLNSGAPGRLAKSFFDGRGAK